MWWFFRCINIEVYRKSVMGHLRATGCDAPNRLVTAGAICADLQKFESISWISFFNFYNLY